MYSIYTSSNNTTQDVSMTVPWHHDTTDSGPVPGDVVPKDVQKLHAEMDLLNRCAVEMNEMKWNGNK